MNCHWVEQHIDAYEIGDLGSRDHELLDAHLAGCETCRGLLERLRATDQRLRDALAWAEPGDGFARRVAEAAVHLRPRRLSLARVAALAAAAALCVALLQMARTRPQTHLPPPSHLAGPEEVVAGQLHDPYGRLAHTLVDGHPYVAVAHTALNLGPRSHFVFAQGTQFARAPDPRDATLAMSVHSGTFLGHVGTTTTEVKLELSPELGGAIARTAGCQFYSTGCPATRLATTQSLEPQELADWPEDIRVHVFTGHLAIDLGTHQLSLQPGDSCIIAAGTTAGATHTIEAHAAELRRTIGQATLERRRRYQALRAQYAHRLLFLRSAKGSHLPQRARRIALLNELITSHTQGLARLEAARPQILELDAAEFELRRHEQLREEALDVFQRLLDETTPS